MVLQLLFTNHYNYLLQWFLLEYSSSVRPINTSTSRTDTEMLRDQSKTVTIAIGVSTVILLIVSSTLIITVVVLIWNYKRKSSAKHTDSSYSTLNRGTGQQTQPQSVKQDSAQLYDQIHLSPSTGQTEFIPKSESANINNPSTTLQNSHPTYLIANDDRVEHSMALNAAYRGTISQLSSQKTHESTCMQLTYAAVDKSKNKFKKQTKKEDSKYKAAEKGPPVSPYEHKISSASMQETKGIAEKQESYPSHTIEELYTAVKKKPKDSMPKDEEETPPIPPCTVEELYTAVEKNPKSNADENKEQTVLQNMAEDLYTAVIKKPNGGSMDDAEAAPPLSPYTVEELYTALIKKPKESAEDEEKAPPIPPYTVEEN